MTPVAIGDIQRTQGTLKTVCKAKNRYRHLLLLLLCLHWAQFKDPVSHMCLAGAVVASWSPTQKVAGWQV